ncbi:Small-conductance mechanosensitive channel [Anaerohalosphaera lusitana]|uniref:Small-conductance mechanosensitive channel n=1 Tax=Anaerohalosphaera lusitana TaxID=1936003 RepID=A0A1U9NJ67_9BACT|nr:mechanosensitive ion channel family protein [Anaerohalosphaera lusitana]AQT67778.1 Small-conductance mechanosensitive channel [Anaerohalosphaera lusitana]
MEAFFEDLYAYAAAYGLRILAAIIVFAVGIWLARLLSGLAEMAALKSQLEENFSRFLRNASYATLIVIVAVAALGVLGIPTASIIVLIAAAALAVGLAIQGSLANFASGINLSLDQPFKVGDIVEIANRRGKVNQIRLFTTIINTPDNVRIIIPNSRITSTSICNYTVNGTRRLDLTFNVSYEEKIDRARHIIMNVLAMDARVLADPEPVVAIKELGDSAIRFAVQPWVRAADYWQLKYDLNTEIKQALDENHIAIPYPHREIHVIGSSPASHQEHAPIEH